MKIQEEFESVHHPLLRRDKSEQPKGSYQQKWHRSKTLETTNVGRGMIKRSPHSLLLRRLSGLASMGHRLETSPERKI